MGRATMSVMGIYNYCMDNPNELPDIFSGFAVPAGVDRENLISKILYDTCDMECLYTNPWVLEDMITAWTACNIQQWERLWETCTYDYNPFENYDMTEEYTRTPDLRYNTTRTPNLTQVSTNSGTDTSNSYISAFNDTSGLYNNARQTAQLGTSNTINNTGTETDNRTETGTEKYTKTTKGDASVRSASQVIEEMRRERLWSFYQYVIDGFIDNFCNKCYAL